MRTSYVKTLLVSAVTLCVVWPQAAFSQRDKSPTVQVWAVSDGVRVSPTTGRLLEARPDIHKDYPAGDYRARNPVWDSATKTVSLKAARNEFVAFQLIMDIERPVEDVDVELLELKDPDGRRITGHNIGIFKEWYVHVRHPSTGYQATSLGPDWYPDALMPKRRARDWSGFPFSIPDLYNNIQNQRNHAVWIDIFVPNERSQAPPGRYTGTAEVSWKGGRDGVTVALDVWDFALPQENHLPGDIWNGSMKNMPPEQEMQYYQFCRQHRVLPLIYAYRPKVSVQGTKVSLDWTEYDKRLAPYLDGSAFTEQYGYWGPGYGEPVDHMMLPFDIKRKNGTAWPIDVPEGGPTPDYEAVWKEVGRQVRAHLDKDPNWRKVMKIAFLNGLDESYNEEAYKLMLYYGRLLHEAMGRGWFKYRVDGGYSREAMDKLSKEVELWICHTEDFEAGDIEHYRKLGVDRWFYGPMMYPSRQAGGCGTNTFLDENLLMERAIPWVAWKYLSGWVHWEFDWHAYAAWFDPETVKRPGRSCNDSGQLIYRGAVMGYKEPIASIRFKSLRRGLQDYGYFWLLTEKTGSRAAGDRLVNEIVYKNPFGKASMLDTELWKNNPDEWDTARLAAGKLISSEGP
jgi:hypothetical protein